MLKKQWNVQFYFVFQTCSEEDFISGKHCYSSSQASKNAVSKHRSINSLTSPHGFPLSHRLQNLFSDLLMLRVLSDCLLQYLFAGEHLDLTALMNTWTLQKGIPLVTVTRKGPRLLLQQDRFLRTVLPSDPHWSTLQQGWACTCSCTVILLFSLLLYSHSMLLFYSLFLLLQLLIHYYQDFTFKSLSGINFKLI